MTNNHHSSLESSPIETRRLENVACLQNLPLVRKISSFSRMWFLAKGARSTSTQRLSNLSKMRTKRERYTRKMFLEGAKSDWRCLDPETRAFDLKLVREKRERRKEISNFISTHASQIDRIFRRASDAKESSFLRKNGYQSTLFIIFMKIIATIARISIEKRTSCFEMLISRAFSFPSRRGKKEKAWENSEELDNTWVIQSESYLGNQFHRQRNKRPG